MTAAIVRATSAARAGRSRGTLTAPLAPRERDAQAEHLRAFLDAHLFQPVTMAAAAATIGASPTALARSFARAFGIAPHAYVTGRRLEAARERLLGGQGLADGAAEVGFYDQAHFSRRFRDYLGTTPGRFRQASEPWRRRLPRHRPGPAAMSSHRGN